MTYNGTTYSVTSIGNSAFYWCSGLTSIEIPNSVTSFGRYAFYGCTGLTSIVIPSGVTSIGWSAFDGCTGLTSIEIPSSVTSIGDCAFNDCTKLTSIEIPSSVTSIGSSAFSGCTGLTSISIPNSVTSIGSSAFSGCTGLTSIEIPSSVTSIGERAFWGCTGLASITVPENVTSVGTSAFEGTDKVIWMTNTPPNGYDKTAGTTNYVSNNLYTSLKNVTVYPYLSSMFEVDGVKYVPVSPAERTCDAIDCRYDESAANINIGNTVSYKGVAMTIKEVKPYTLSKNKNIKSVELAFNGHLGEYAFYGCSNIASAKINNNGNIGIFAFSGCATGSTPATFEIGNQGNIGIYAFSRCTGLKKAIINCKSIGEESFEYCYSLQSVEFGQYVRSIGRHAFCNCALAQIEIPDNVKSIGKEAFSGCSSMTSVKIGNGISEITESAFFGCTGLTNIEFGLNVTNIAGYAFSNCKALGTITLPKSVTKIEDYAFYGCTGLKNVIMEDGKVSFELKLGSNGSSPLFADCPLDSVYIGRNISYNTGSDYGYSPFYRNASLRSVHINDWETEISANEFYGCSKLKNVRIGDGVTMIGDWAFSGCSSLDFFAFGTAVKSIGKEAFSDCTAMTRLTSKATVPPTCGAQALDDINKWNCTLSVPEGYIAAYQQAAQWKDFFFVEEHTGIESITQDATPSAKTHIDLTGKKVITPQRGQIYLQDGKKAMTR
ncbi:MAG: leucine-rich repeat domain-containing protein [Bacteroidales bacterium]|nr:leucine-rich repeat domain-containing protein [Bacteroidales bacterium]